MTKRDLHLHPQFPAHMQTQTNDARHKQKTKTDAAYTETKKHRERAAQKSDQGSLKIWCDDDDQGKQQEKDQEKQARDIAETMCLSVDESPHMIAMEDGAAAIAAMYTLCVDDGINTVGEYLEIKEHLDGLLCDMYDKMREIYPVPAQGESGDKSKQCIGADTAQEECT